jgi:uncharacterized protein
MDSNNEIQSTPHSPDPTWSADSPSGDYVSPSIESDIPAQNPRTDTPDSMSDSNHGHSPSRQQFPTLNDDHSFKPILPPQPLLPDSESLSTSQQDPAAACQPAVKEEESRSEESQEQPPSHPPAPKVKLSLRDFVLRKKKQREEEMTKNVQDTQLSAALIGFLYIPDRIL